MSQVNEAGEQTTELQVYAELAAACYQLAKLTIERDSLREQNRTLQADLDEERRLRRDLKEVALSGFEDIGGFTDVVVKEKRAYKAEAASLREQNRVLRAAGQAVVEMYRDAPRPHQVDELDTALKPTNLLERLNK